MESMIYMRWCDSLVNHLERINHYFSAVPTHTMNKMTSIKMDDVGRRTSEVKRIYVSNEILQLLFIKYVDCEAKILESAIFFPLKIHFCA